MRSERIVVLMKHYLGDAVMATPLIDGLIGLQSSIGLVSTPTVCRLLAAPFRPLETIEVDRTARSLQETVRLARSLRKRRFDVAIVVNRSFRSALSARLAGIKVRAGHDNDWRAALLTHSTPYDWQKSEAESYLDLPRLVGLDLPPVEPKLVATKVERVAGKKLLSGATVAVQPGASLPWKRLPVPILADLIDSWHQSGYVTALVGGPEESAAGDELRSALTVPTVNLIGGADIRSMMGAMANLRFILGGDTGLIHVAAGVGCPTLTVFGAKPPASKWGHFYDPHIVVEAPDGRVDQVTLTTLEEGTLRLAPGLERHKRHSSQAP